MDLGMDSSYNYNNFGLEQLLVAASRVTGNNSSARKWFQ